MRNALLLSLSWLAFAMAAPNRQQIAVMRLRRRLATRRSKVGPAVTT